MIYFYDSSALVKRYVAEKLSAEITSLVCFNDVAISRYSLIEIASALARRNREGILTIASYNHLMVQLHHDILGMAIVELGKQVTDKALSLLLRHPLRAGDAIQLASCLHLRDRLGSDITFVAFDNRLVNSAVAEGLPVWS